MSRGAYLRSTRTPYSKSRKAILKRAGGKCVYCGCKLSVKSRGHRKRMTIDHVIPKSKGGPNTVGNLAASCSDCNNKKGNKMPEAG